MIIEGDCSIRRMNLQPSINWGEMFNFADPQANMLPSIGKALLADHVVKAIQDGRDVGCQGLSSGGKPKPCMKFFSTSGCPFGESCHFSHYIPGGLSSLGLAPIVSLSAASAAAAQRKAPAPVGDPSVTVNGYKTKLCNRFNTAEGCRFGDKCHFAHGESDLRAPNNMSRGSNMRTMSEGPSGTGSPGFSNVDSQFSDSSYGNVSNFNSQSCSEPNPPGVAGSDAPASYSSGPTADNVQVY
ncbi:uncharacterized protein LOC143888461 isoform X2 [Tasmannia lanceolata]|uniref:uncharacterized protein LOC143859730 isoform X2 n=1 Tax=Tasmannia lanceolata TaxID=3420 RepID=UPI0040636278